MHSTVDFYCQKTVVRTALPKQFSLRRRSNLALLVLGVACHWPLEIDSSIISFCVNPKLTSAYLSLARFRCAKVYLF